LDFLKRYPKNLNGENNMNNQRRQEDIPEIAVPFEEPHKPGILADPGSHLPHIHAAAG
jgi:hypothetical protein